MSDQQYQVLQPIQVTSTGLKTYTGDSILSNCFTAASVAEKDSDGIVLGIVSAEGPVALHDINLGEASHISRYLFFPQQQLTVNPLPTSYAIFAAAALQYFCELSSQQDMVDDTSLGIPGSGHFARCFPDPNLCLEIHVTCAKDMLLSRSNC